MEKITTDQKLLTAVISRYQMNHGSIFISTCEHVICSVFAVLCKVVLQRFRGSITLICTFKNNSSNNMYNGSNYQYC